MNILLMEDMGDKIQAIKKALEDAGHNYNTVSCVKEFRTHISQKPYDMIIIDMVVPEKNGGTATMENGFKAINYLRTTTEPIYRPQSVVVLSSYIDEKLVNKLNRYAMRAIKYSPIDSTWSEELMEELEYASMLSTKKADIVIMSAVDIEYKMVERMFDWQEFECLEDDAIYKNAEVINKKGEKLSVVSCHPIRMGAIAATNLTTKAINMFKPDCIIMVGIAGGNANEVKCGDIVVAENAVDFCSGSIEDDDKAKIQFLPDEDILHASQGIVKTMRRYKNDKVLLRTIRDSTGDLAKERDIHIHIGQMATGPAVVKSNIFTNEYLKKHHRKYLAVDMESYGVYFGARNSQHRNIEVVSIKGITDAADRDKDDNYQAYCSLSVCNLVKHYIIDDYNKKVLY